MSSFKRSFTLLKSSWAVLQQQKTLLWLPVLSGLSSIIWVGLFMLTLFHGGFIATFAKNTAESSNSALSPLMLVWLFTLYFVSFTISVYFNSAMCHCAHKLLNGQPTSLGDGLKMANKRFLLILQWAFVSATLGVLLQLIRERFGFIGRLVVLLLGLAWAAISYLVVPIMVIEGKSPLTALKESGVILKKTWGENVLGFFGISFLFSLLMFLVVVLGFIILPQLFNSGFLRIGMIVLGIGAVSLVLLAVFRATLGMIYRVALYQFAVSDGTGPTGFDQQLLQDAARQRRKKATLRR